MNNFKDYLNNAKTPKSEEDIELGRTMTETVKVENKGEFLIYTDSDEWSLARLTKPIKKEFCDLSDIERPWSNHVIDKLRFIKGWNIVGISLDGIVIGALGGTWYTGTNVGKTGYVIHIVESNLQDCNFGYLTRFGFDGGWPGNNRLNDERNVEVYFGISSLYKNCKITIASQKKMLFNSKGKDQVSFNFLNCRFENCHIENTSSIKLNYPGCEFVNTKKI